MLLVVKGAPPSSQQGGVHGKRRFQSKLHTAYTKSAKAQIATQWTEELLPKTSPVSLDLVILYKTPKSWSQAKTNQLHGTHNVSVPDSTNVAKTIEDTLVGSVLEDDCCVQWARVARVWSKRIHETTSFIEVLQLAYPAVLVEDYEPLYVGFFLSHHADRPV